MDMLCDLAHVCNRFCSLTIYADILMLQILNTIEGKKGIKKTSEKTVKKGINGKLKLVL